MEFKVGDKFKRKYPFIRYCVDSMSWGEHSTVEGWRPGCSHESDGDGVILSCDAEGGIEFEVLAVFDLPRKYQRRVAYCLTMIDPEGCAKKGSTVHLATVSKFAEWLDGYTSYPRGYEVTD